MNIDIQANGLNLTTGLRQHIRNRFFIAFQGTKQHLRKITVRLIDVNGPRGGQDKKCRVHLGVVGGQDVVIENTDTQLHSAIEGATNRAQNTLARRIDKRREKKAIKPSFTSI
jgi:ribosome-associated translation inhibitor RaiA